MQAKAEQLVLYQSKLPWKNIRLSFLICLIIRIHYLITDLLLHLPFFRRNHSTTIITTIKVGIHRRGQDLLVLLLPQHYIYSRSNSLLLLPAPTIIIRNSSSSVCHIPVGPQQPHMALMIFRMSLPDHKWPPALLRQHRRRAAPPSLVMRRTVFLAGILALPPLSTSMQGRSSRPPLENV